MIKPILNNYLFVFIGFITFLLGGCGTDEKMDDESVKELVKGTVEYKVSYPYFKGDDFTRAMLPKQMFFVFEGDKINSYTKKGGFLKMGVMGVPKKDSISMYIDFGQADFKSNFSGPKRIQEFIGHQSDLEITLVEGEEKKIAGLQCKKADVKYVNADLPDFSVYYTEELSIESPNFYNPYNEIPGVLMEFQMERFGLVSSIVADTFYTDLPKEHKFDLDSNFLQIQFLKFEDKIRDLFEKSVGAEHLTPKDSL